VRASRRPRHRLAPAARRGQRIPARVVLGVVAGLCAMALAGCGDTPSRRADQSVAARSPTPSSTAVDRGTPPRRHRGPRHTPTATATAAPPALHACDPNITVRAATTTCGFAQNVFYAFYTDGSFETQNGLRAYSPATGHDYAVACATDGAENVTCVAGDGGEVHFNLAAVRVYDDVQAARYANTHDLGPGAPSHVGESVGGVGNPQDQPTDIPSDENGPTPANEIPNYDNGNGYPVQCADGMWSQSGGIQGACSGHGGLG
jgi:hypothetical protein